MSFQISPLLLFFINSWLTITAPEVRTSFQQLPHNLSSKRFLGVNMLVWDSVNWTFSCSQSTLHSCCFTPEIRAGDDVSKGGGTRRMSWLMQDTQFSLTLTVFTEGKGGATEKPADKFHSFSPPTVTEKGDCYLEFWHLQSLSLNYSGRKGKPNPFS